MMQRIEIEQRANDILRTYGITEKPFLHIREMCDREAIRIRKAKFSHSMDGAFSVIQNEKYIFINPEMMKERQNFTKAHELGHYYLNHHLEAGNAIYCNNLHENENDHQHLPRIETEANYFATYFLMPEHMVRKEYQSIARVMGIDTTRRLYVDRQPDNQKNWQFVYRHFKTRFGVSQAALGYRLDSLGLVRYLMK